MFGYLKRHNTFIWRMQIFPLALQLVIQNYSFESQLFYSIILKSYRLLSDRHSREEGLFIIKALLL